MPESMFIAQCVFFLFHVCDFMSGEKKKKGRYSQGGVVDEVFEVDAAAVLCQVSETAVTHWNNKMGDKLNTQTGKFSSQKRHLLRLWR